MRRCSPWPVIPVGAVAQGTVTQKEAVAIATEAYVYGYSLITTEQELLVAARERSVQLSQLRYRGGLDSYLQVPDAETRLFDGQLQLADLKRDELTAMVRLYRALGGGWSSVIPSNGQANR